MAHPMLPLSFTLLIHFQFTGDGAGRDHEGYYWIRGRVDDVVNVSGHRLSTAEIEAALIHHRMLFFVTIIITLSQALTYRSGCGGSCRGWGRG